MDTTAVKKTIKLYFTDFWKGFDACHNVFTETLSRHYTIKMDPNPDYLFFSSFGYDHLNHRDCIKIYFTGENNVPDFNLCDYALGFHFLEFGDRYLRFPVYLLDKEVQRLELERQIDPANALNRKFCNFVYTNNKLSDPIREICFRKLSEYKQVDSGGRLLNNIGAPVPQKLPFIRDYKFTIAFENSCVQGYTTEKMTDPMRVDSLPVYWGNPAVESDFNKAAFVHVNDFATIDAAIAEVIRLDRDDEAYLKQLSQPRFSETGYYQCQLNRLEVFLRAIVEQPLEQARRTAAYGYAQRYFARQKKMAKLLSFKPLSFILR
ncbi:MAG: glycosyltransferase [Dysgonamonadaceae bacterium]|jgi:hypothetical protein|nr:glycosyltransferase [Dysgonamonadaceae bacterium]